MLTIVDLFTYSEIYLIFNSESEAMAYPIPGGARGQFGWDSGQPDLIWGGQSTAEGLEIYLSDVFLPKLFYDNLKLNMITSE